MKNPSALCAAIWMAAVVAMGGAEEGPGYSTTFAVEKSDLISTGRNPYFILEPGYRLEYEGEDDGEKVALVITVLDETRMVNGIETRIVEERETKDGRPSEVSRNYFAICKRTNSVYYFGEDVDIYKDGKVANHDGSWLSGVNGARFGLAMPGLPLLGARYHQEVAPGVAMDRAEIVGLSETLKTPAGTFRDCVKIAETTPLESGRETKVYAPGVGQLNDGPIRLVRHGKAAK